MDYEIDEFGSKRWFKEGEFHRLDGPAVEYANGSKYWDKEGELHREDGPAIEYDDGHKFWYKGAAAHAGLLIAGAALGVSRLSTLV